MSLVLLCETIQQCPIKFTENALQSHKHLTFYDKHLQVWKANALGVTMTYLRSPGHEVLCDDYKPVTDLQQSFNQSKNSCVLQVRSLGFHQ